MSGAIPVFPPCALMALTENFTFFFPINVLPLFGESQGMIFITSCIASTTAEWYYMLSLQCCVLHEYLVTWRYLRLRYTTSTGYPFLFGKSCSRVRCAHVLHVASGGWVDLTECLTLQRFQFGYTSYFTERTPLVHGSCAFNPLKPELNSICYLLALLAHHFLHVSRIRVKSLTFRRLMSYIYTYIYGAPILDVSRSHTTTQHSR